MLGKLMSNKHKANYYYTCLNDQNSFYEAFLLDLNFNGVSDKIKKKVFINSYHSKKSYFLLPLHTRRETAVVHSVSTGPTLSFWRAEMLCYSRSASTILSRAFTSSAICSTASALIPSRTPVMSPIASPSFSTSPAGNHLTRLRT